MKPAGEVVHRSDFEVRDVDASIGRSLVERFHYAGGASNTYVHLHGLFQTGGEECLGVAWWLPPTRAAAEATSPSRWRGVLSLSRLVIAPQVPKNAATLLLSRSRKLIDRKTWPVFVTYADSWRGHTGAIYLADNWIYCGETKPQRTYVIAGRMTARKAGPKTRTHAEMIALGAEMVGSFPKRKFVHTPPGVMPCLAAMLM